MSQLLLDSLKLFARTAVFLRNEADAEKAVALAYEAGMIDGERKGFELASDAAFRSVEAKREVAA